MCQFHILKWELKVLVGVYEAQPLGWRGVKTLHKWKKQDTSPQIVIIKSESGDMTSKIMAKHVFSLPLGEGRLHVLTGQIRSWVTVGKLPPCDPESYVCMVVKKNH